MLNPILNNSKKEVQENSSNIYICIFFNLYLNLLNISDIFFTWALCRCMKYNMKREKERERHSLLTYIALSRSIMHSRINNTGTINMLGKEECNNVRNLGVLLRQY